MIRMDAGSTATSLRREAGVHDSKDYCSERTLERIFAHSLSQVVIILKNLRTGGYIKVKDGKITIQRKLLPSW